jgi:hypothetical protein
MLFGFGKKAKDETVAAKSTTPAVAVVEPPAAPTLVAKADALHAAKQVTELFALLEDADASDDELAWRIARAHHDMAEESVGDQARREKLLREMMVKEMKKIDRKMTKLIRREALLRDKLISTQTQLDGLREVRAEYAAEAN